jgi:c-di-GMP-binding flagellar brake protein YcgR
VKKKTLHSRRQHKRVDNPESVWVYWRCGRSEDTSRVRDISIGGVFVETKKTLPIDADVELNFLVVDGGILAKAAVRYVLPGVGVGLQFKNVRTEDQPQFESMMKRVIQLV